ncbi:MAG: metallophosphoesterase [Solobacterium sp.]|nr:metallophosphoesterase [Solobacterium sp.]
MIQNRIRNRWLRGLLFIAKFGLMFVLAFELIADASPFLWKFAYPLMGLYIALFSDWACDIAMFFLSLRKKEQKKWLRPVLLAAFMAVYAFYGTVNSQIIREDHLSFASEKLDRDHRFVFLSDLHYGSSQTRKSFEDALKKINASTAEFVIPGGDICDEHTEKAEMEWVFETLGQLDMPVYYIYGNHDRQERGSYVGGRKYSEAELEQAITDSGIIIVNDEVMQIADDLVLVGREDVSSFTRIPLKDLPEREEETYVIWADHSPYQNEEIREANADLQLSGHTHAGQIFPI